MKTVRESAVQDAFADVSERRVSDIMSQRRGLNQVLVQPQRASNGPSNLGNLLDMYHPRREMVALRVYEHLALVYQTTIGVGVNHPIAVALKLAAQRRRRLWPLSRYVPRFRCIRRHPRF